MSYGCWWDVGCCYPFGGWSFSLGCICILQKVVQGSAVTKAVHAMLFLPVSTPACYDAAVLASSVLCSFFSMHRYRALYCSCMHAEDSIHYVATILNHWFVCSVAAAIAKASLFQMFWLISQAECPWWSLPVQHGLLFIHTQHWFWFAETVLDRYSFSSQITALDVQYIWGVDIGKLPMLSSFRALYLWINAMWRGFADWQTAGKPWQ